MGRAGGGRVSSGGSGTRRTGGGHSSGRVGGGHRVGNSSLGGSRAGSGSFMKSSSSSRGNSRISSPPPRDRSPRMSPPPRDRSPRMAPPRGRGPGMPPPPPRGRGPRMPYSYSGGRRGGYSTYHGGGCGGCLMPFIILGIILIGIMTAFWRNIPFRKWQSPVTSSSSNENTIKNSTDYQENTSTREKLDTNHEYINDCVIDELGWFDDVSETENQLKNFWEKTGVQPYIILRDYDASLTSDSEKEQWAIDYYDNNFDTENIFLFVYFAEEDTDNDVGYMAYANGYETTSVMDSEAVEIFWNNIDKYWYTDLSTDDVFIQTFNDTADKII